MTIKRMSSETQMPRMIRMEFRCLLKVGWDTVFDEAGERDYTTQVIRPQFPLGEGLCHLQIFIVAWRWQLLFLRLRLACGACSPICAAAVSRVVISVRSSSEKF